MSRNSVSTNMKVLGYFAGLFGLLYPTSAAGLSFAETYEGVMPFLYGAIGFLGAAAVLGFGAGFIVYISRMGLDHRVEGIDYMSQAVSALFILTIIISIVAFIQR